MNELIPQNFPTLDFKRPFEFRVEVEAQNLSATGAFKTEIQILEDYEYLKDEIPVACEVPVSCCRLALNPEESPATAREMNAAKKPGMKLVPNPAKDRLVIQLEGLEQNSMLTIVDVLGREVIHMHINKQTELDVRGLSKGIYRVRARDNLSTVFKTLIVE